MPIRGGSRFSKRRLEEFNELSGDVIMEVLGIVDKWYTFGSYFEFRGTFSKQLDDSKKLVDDRVKVYGDMFGCADLVEAKKDRYLYRLFHLTVVLLNEHPLRWYHFGSHRKDLISYRGEVQEVQRRVGLLLQKENK